MVVVVRKICKTINVPLHGKRHQMIQFNSHAVVSTALVSKRYLPLSSKLAFH